jgi:transcriptional regulator with XRE-family HTH domain
VSKPVSRSDREAEAKVKVRFGENLSRLRSQAGLSQRELAERAEMGPTTVAALEEGGGSPRIESLVKVAGALGAEMGELLQGLDWDPAVGPLPGRFVVSPPEQSDAAAPTSAT